MNSTILIILTNEDFYKMITPVVIIKIEDLGCLASITISRKNVQDQLVKRHNNKNN